MSAKRRMVSVIVTLLIAAYLVLMPDYFAKSIGKDPYKEWFEHKEEPFSGVIELWHIVGFKPYIGSLGEWLKGRAKRLEKRHFGVYVEVSAMTVEEYRERIQRNERADIYSFPEGLITDENLYRLPTDELSGIEYAENCRAAVGRAPDRSVCYTFSGYMLMLNNDLLNMCPGEPPGEDEKAADWLRNNAGKIDVAGIRSNSRIYFLAGSEKAAAELGLGCECVGYEFFKANEALCAIADIRTTGDMERISGSEGRFSVQTYPIGEYTDLYQYLGVDKEVNELKLEYIMELIKLITEPDAQAALPRIGLFPAINLEERPIFESKTVQSLYDALSE